MELRAGAAVVAIGVGGVRGYSDAVLAIGGGGRGTLGPQSAQSEPLVQSAYSAPGRRRRRGRRRCRDAPDGAPPEGNAKEAIRRRRRVTTAASSDDSAWHTAAALSCISVIHGVLHRSRRLSPQLAQHVVERGALTHSHDSERSSLCSQRGSLSALCSLRSARSHDFALLASRTRAPLMGGQHHPKECPAQPQPAGLAAHRPQSPYESGVSRHREVARALRQKIQKTQRIEDPYPPLPPPAQCQKFRLYTVRELKRRWGTVTVTRSENITAN